MERIIKSGRDNCGDVLTLPTVPELKAYIKTEKARKKAEGDRSGVLYDFGEGLPAVNAQYLLDTLEIFPDVTTTTISKWAPLVSALYFKSEFGEGVLLPVRKAAKQ